MKKPRLPEEAVRLLRKKGGVHETKKGAKGYKRQEEKKKIKKQLNNL